MVNSAGHGPKGPILELTDEDWHIGMDAYFMNVVRSSRLVTPIMQQQKSGVIITYQHLRHLNQILYFQPLEFSERALHLLQNYLLISMLLKTLE